MPKRNPRLTSEQRAEARRLGIKEKTLYSRLTAGWGQDSLLLPTKKQAKGKSISTRLPPDIEVALKEYAHIHGLSISQALAQIVESYLN